MNDMIGVQIKPDDIIVYNGSILKVKSVHKNTIKYYKPNGSTSSTHLSTNILVLNDFNIDNINNLISINQDRINTLHNVSAPQIIIKSPEEILKEQLQKAELSKINKNLEKFSLVFDNNYCYVYLGHKVCNTNITGDKYHWYLKLGYVRRNYDLPSNVLEELNRNIYPVDNWYNRMMPIMLKSKKRIFHVNNTYKDQLIRYYSNLPIVAENDLRYRSFEKIRYLIQ